jgi:3-oxoadipate CoA-transferase beta subunit
VSAAALGMSTDEIARQVALELPDGSYVNLGIGLPQKVARFIPDGREVVLHAENGILGAGPPATADERDVDLIDAGKQAITVRAGASFVSHCESFAMIRGGHIDYTVLGAFQVSGDGDIANWDDGSGDLPAVGGAMDLAKGAKHVFVIMRHTTAAGVPKIVPACTLPLTGERVVTRIFTELGTFEPNGGTLLVHALAPGVDLPAVAARTAVAVHPSAQPRHIGVHP